jgi:diguanylate cyclase (GGDEF)-like protein
LSLLLIDVDGLKGINDRRGHRAGDAALVRVAAALRRTARQTDLTARWGGDEFALLAPDTRGAAALRLGERICALVSETARTDGEPMTVSVGVATMDGAPDDGALQLRERADAALYAAKRQGRNRVAGEPATTAPPP